MYKKSLLIIKVFLSKSFHTLSDYPRAIVFRPFFYPAYGYITVRFLLWDQFFPCDFIPTRGSQQIGPSGSASERARQILGQRGRPTRKADSVPMAQAARQDRTQVGAGQRDVSFQDLLHMQAQDQIGCILAHVPRHPSILAFK